MNIGIICYPTFGGSGVVATELGLNLARKGYGVHFITYSQPHRLDVFSKNIFYHEVAVYNYPLFKYPPYELALASKIVDVTQHEELDLVHVHYAVPHASAAYMAKQILKTKGIELPIVTTLHGTDITLVGKDPSYEPVVTFSINASDKVTAVSESLKKETYDYFDVNNGIEVIPNFIDLDRFKHNERNIEYKNNICVHNEKLIVHASNFRKVKRVPDIVKVFNQIVKQIPAKLILIGDGPERNKVEQMCREMGICEHIRFLGKLERVENVFAISDLFMLTSEKESFGLAALEAMACEVPVISTNSGGIGELNIHGYSGMLSNVGDIDDMAQNALHILHDDNLPRFKQNALERANAFQVEKILPMYEKVYNAALGQIKTA